MAELFASSSDLRTNDHELVSNPISHDDQTTTTDSELTSIDSTNLHSNLLHRRIVTMLETLKTSTNEDEPTTTTTTTASSSLTTSQPITFGQLRQATITDDKPNAQSTAIDRTDKHLRTWSTFKRESCPDLSSTTATKKSQEKSQMNRERLYGSPSVERFFQEQNPISQTKKDEEQSQKSTLTVDEILAMYYSKANQSINNESHLSSTNYANTSTGLYIHSSQQRWTSSLNNLHSITTNPTPLPPRLVLHEQNRTRPPPPSYSSSIAQSHRTISTLPNPVQHQINHPVLPPILEHLYPSTYSPPHLLAENVHSNSSSTFVPTVVQSATKTAVRPPPPRYVSPSSDSDRSNTAVSSPINNDPTPSSQQGKSSTTGYDREFSRLLYGRDPTKIRRQKQKRKAFSDPVKQSVEEAGRSMEKANRRVTTHLNKTDTVKEEAEADNDDTESDRSNVENKNLHLLPRRRFQRQSDLIDKTRESAQKAIIPANPSLKRRIPSFLRVYSQASSSNDILLQWHLFNLSELESFYTMMTRLYKNENLARVQLYEIYRTALLSALSTKKPRITTTDNDSITTPL